MSWSFKTWKTMGGGISSTTISPSPFHTYTKTPDVRNVRMAPKNMDATALPAMDASEVAAPPKHSCNGAPPPVSTVEYHLRAGFQNSSFVGMLHADNQDVPTKNYQALLDNPAYFNFNQVSETSSRPDRIPTAASAFKNVLIERLEEVKTKLGDSLKLPPEMKGADMVVVTQAVAMACKGFHPHLAARGLKCLSEVNLHASIANPDTLPPNGFDGQELACAWRIAQALEQTPIGFAALKKIAQPAHGGQPVHNSVKSHDDTMLHVFLRASREKTRLNRSLPPHPQAILDSIPNTPSELIDKSLLAVQAHLRQSREHVENSPSAAFAATRDAYEWAIGAVINGFYTDKKTDEHGNTTPFYKAEQRIRKMSKWVSRANGTNNKDPDGSRHDVLGKDASKMKRVTRFLRNTLLPGMKKSPFNALNRQAPETVLPYVGAVPGSGFRNAEGGGVGEARAIKDMVDNLEKALERGLEAKGASLTDRIANPDENTLRDMVRLAILKQGKANTKIMPRYVSIGLNDRARTMVKKHVYGKLQGGIRGQSQETQNFINGLIDNQHSNLTPETLNEWANDAGCPSSVPHPDVQQAADQPDWHIFRMAQRRVLKPVLPTATPNLKTISKADTAHMIENHTKTHEMGSRVVLYSGGIAGVGTKQLVALVSRVVSKGLLRFHADVRAEGVRCATAEIGTGPQGTELFLGTQRIMKGQVGGGASVGINTASTIVSAVVGGSAAVGMEGQDRNGVIIRFDRLNGGFAVDHENSAKLARLSGKLIAPGDLPNGDPYVNAQGDDGKSPLKNLWQEWPEVSVSVAETKDKVGRASTSASAGFGAAFFGNFRFGMPSASIGIEGKFKGKNTWTETGGALHVDKKSTYWTVKATASGTVATVGRILNTATPNVDMILSGGELAGGSVDFWKNGYTVTDTFIEHQGELKKNTVRIKSYQTAQAFVDNVASKLDEWAEEKTKRFYPNEYGAIAPENELPTEQQRRMERRNAAIDAEHTRLSQHLRRALDAAEPTQTFWEFKEIRSDAVAAANALKSVAAMASVCGDRQSAQECTKSRDKLLKSEEAWEPTFMMTYETTAQQRMLAPVNFFFKSAQLDGITVSNMKLFN